MKLLRVNRDATRAPCWINPQHVVHIDPAPVGAEITLIGGSILVTDSVTDLLDRFDRRP